MADETYNGWPNYETWLVNVWMDNEEAGQRFYAERAREVYADAEPRHTLTREETARIDYADWLKEHVHENRPELPGMYSDLLGAALGSVNWDRLARHWIDAAVEVQTNG
jgi:hypothetical protein